jgi:hypothetical protein
MLGIRAFVSIGGALVGTCVALGVLLAINRWLDVEVAGQVAVSMTVFALTRDLTAECLERLMLSMSARHVYRLLAEHLSSCERRVEQPIRWSRLHHAVERLMRMPSQHRLHAQQCLGELESYSEYKRYTQILVSCDMNKTRSLVDSLAPDEPKRVP